MRCKVSSFVREAGALEAVRPRFVLTFPLPPFDLLVVVKLLVPLLLTDGDVLATDSAGKIRPDSAAFVVRKLTPQLYACSGKWILKLDTSIAIYMPSGRQIVPYLTPLCCGMSCDNAAAVRIRCP